MKVISIKELLEKFLNWFDKGKRKIFLTIFIIGFTSNIIVITNDIVSTDTIALSEVYIPGSWELFLGRWLLKYFGYLRFGLVSSALNSTLSLITISFTGVLLIDLFKIKHKLSIFLTCILLVVSPFFTSTLISVFCSFEYSLAFFFSVLCVYLLYKIKGSILKIILPSILLACSLGLYQAYLGVTCGLCILVPLVYLLIEEETPKYILKKLLQSLIMGVMGLIIYEVILQISLSIFDVSMSTYGGANEIGIKTILGIPSQLKTAYLSFYNYFMNDTIINNLIYRRHIAHLVLFILTLLTILKLYFKNKNKKSLIFNLEFIMFIILIPIALGILTIIAKDRELYSLMSAPYILIYIFIFSLIEKKDTKKAFENIVYCATILVSIFIINSYLVMTNATYMSLRITKEKTLFTSQRIINEIYNIEEYNKDMKVLFIGTTKGDNFTNPNKVYELSSSNSLFDPLMWSEPIMCNRGWHHFIKYYLGIELKEATIEDYNNIINTSEFDSMNTYPNVEFIKVIDDILVVKVQEK
ncbi:MAG: glucosyltransferase domain-containing protein [Bacilli bacterium]|nr:glucosyltransferase domain-containing protein [Bacilli bacterium]